MHPRPGTDIIDWKEQEEQANERTGSFSGSIERGGNLCGGYAAYGNRSHGSHGYGTVSCGEESISDRAGSGLLVCASVSADIGLSVPESGQEAGNGTYDHKVRQKDCVGIVRVWCSLRLSGTDCEGTVFPVGYAGESFLDGAAGRELVTFVVSVSDSDSVCADAFVEKDFDISAAFGAVWLAGGSVYRKQYSAICDQGHRTGNDSVSAGLGNIWVLLHMRFSVFQRIP